MYFLRGDATRSGAAVRPSRGKQRGCGGPGPKPKRFSAGCRVCCYFSCGGSSVAVTAVQQIRRMRGGAQSQLMLASDGHLYVVKFRNNPQHVRVLANELLATRLAESAGLAVPPSEI